MKFEMDGKTWTYNERAVSVQRAAIITKETGLMWPMEVLDRLGKLDPQACLAMMWVVRSQNEIHETIDQMPEWSQLDFAEAFGEAMNLEEKARADAAAKKPADPQPAAVEGGPSTTTSESSETVTS